MKKGLIEYQHDFYEFYYTCLKKNFNLQINETNQIYIKYDSLKHSILSKLEENKVLTEEESNTRKMMIYQFHYMVHWGNYAETEILKNDIEYILWCLINLDHFAIVKRLFLLPQARKHRYFIDAFEINSIKQLIVEKWQQSDDKFYIYRSESEYLFDDYNDRVSQERVGNGRLGL